MNSILNAIVDNKRREIEARAMLGIYDKALSHATKSVYTPVSMSRSITDNEVGIIAEFKRRSPSRGDIHPGAVADEIVLARAVEIVGLQARTDAELCAI